MTVARGGGGLQLLVTRVFCSFWGIPVAFGFKVPLMIDRNVFTIVWIKMIQMAQTFRITTRHSLAQRSVSVDRNNHSVKHSDFTTHEYMYELPSPTIAYSVVFPWYKSGKNKKENIWNVEWLTVFPHRESILMHKMNSSNPRRTKTTFSPNRNVVFLSIMLMHLSEDNHAESSSKKESWLSPKVHYWWAGEQSDPQTLIVCLFSAYWSSLCDGMFPFAVYPCFSFYSAQTIPESKLIKQRESWHEKCIR